MNSLVAWHASKISVQKHASEFDHAPVAARAGAHAGGQHSGAGAGGGGNRGRIRGWPRESCSVFRREALPERARRIRSDRTVRGWTEWQVFYCQALVTQPTRALATAGGVLLLLAIRPRSKRCKDKHSAVLPASFWLPTHGGTLMQGGRHFCLLTRGAAARCREEGLAGLWTGVGPNIARNAIINAVELASYDTVRPLPGSLSACQISLRCGQRCKPHCGRLCRSLSARMHPWKHRSAW